MKIKKILVFCIIFLAFTKSIPAQAVYIETENVLLDLSGSKTETLSPSELDGYDVAKVSYKFSGKGVVSVKKNDKDLIITAKKKGISVLTETVTYKKGNKKKNVKIKYKLAVINGRKDIDVSLNMTDTKKKTIKAPAMAGYKASKVSYKLSKQGIITVKKNKTNLKIYSKKAGTTKLTEKITYKKGSKKKTVTKVYNLTVTKKPVDIKEIALDSRVINLKKGNTISLTAIFQPMNATTQKVEFTSSNSKVVKVKNDFDNTATVTAINSGIAVVTARVGNHSSTCKIVVEDNYSYSIIPLLPPFNEYFYVKTDNPNVSNIRFVDKDSKYLEDDTYYGYAAIIPSERRFLDVQYVNYNKGQVNGGYIFSYDGAFIDGGELTLQIRGSDDYYAGYADTSKTVECPAVKDYKDYLIDTYTTEKMTFFEKMDAVQAGMDELALYPRSTLDVKKPNKETPYPFLTVSPYPELGLNDWYLMYDYSEDGLLLNALYPYVADSLGFPSIMYYVAEKFDPTCKIEWGSLHFLIDVTKDGITKSYGGAGEGGLDPLLSSRVETLFKFDGSADDYASNVSIKKLADKRNEYGKYAREDMDLYHDLLYGETFKKTVSPGSWLRVTKEGFSIGSVKVYAYVTQGDSFKDDYTETYIREASNVWVDGRYVNIHEFFVKGAKFEDYPNANIMIRNMKYKDQDGEDHIGDVLYYYDEKSDTWISEAYWNNKWYVEEDRKLPDEFILTREEAVALNLDRNTDIDPPFGYIYDSSVAPGTPFKND